MTNPCIGTLVEDSDETLAPESAGGFLRGYSFQVNGPGAAAVPTFVPCLQELLQALDYWVRINAEGSFWQFMTADVDNPAWRLWTFAQRRIERIKAALHNDPRIDSFIETRYEDQGSHQNPLAWRVFRKQATPEEVQQFEREKHQLLTAFLAEYDEEEDDEE